jgi:hypothetical protein
MLTEIFRWRYGLTNSDFWTSPLVLFDLRNSESNDQTHDEIINGIIFNEKSTTNHVHKRDGSSIGASALIH